MHTVSEMGTSVPAFLGKLWRLVEDPETDELICWAPDGRSFFIKNQAQFARELLPHYYKHNNMASFVRQLNMYGFHKKVSVELGGLKCDRDEMEFAHQCFSKNHPYLLERIKRKIASTKTQDPTQQPIKPELMNRMLTEVRSMRGRQEHFDSRLIHMKKENEALWRELALLRQKHHKQQQIVNKLIHFLASLVSPNNRNSGLQVKRRYQLMIDDADRQKVKHLKTSKMQQSPTGPAIHELDCSEPDLDSEYIVDGMLDSEPPTVESPEHSVTEDNMREYYINEPSPMSQDSDVCHNTSSLSRKRIKGKKKGEETYYLEMPSGKLQPTTVTTNVRSTGPSTTAKVIDNARTTTAKKTNPSTKTASLPISGTRSSKIAAMVANMKKPEPETEELDLDLDTLQDSAEDINESTRDNSFTKLENILTMPDYNPEIEDNNTMPSSVSSMSSTGVSGNSPGSSGGMAAIDRSPEALSDIENGAFGQLQYMAASDLKYENPEQQSQKHQQRSSTETARSPAERENMSLSRINQEPSESNYRLGSA